MRKAVEIFLKQGSGNIINIASVGGLNGQSLAVDGGWTAY